MTKATKTNLDMDRNRKVDEAAPAAVSDVETMPKVEEQERGEDTVRTTYAVTHCLKPKLSLPWIQ